MPPANAGPRRLRLSNDSAAGDEPPTKQTVAVHRGPIALPPLLSRCASEVAVRWASRIWSRTPQEKRRALGGWPGTLSEARFVVADQLVPGLGVECLHELELVDREQVARFLYRSARTWWRQRGPRDVEDVG